jgi:exodeoxyribonuclease V gamma subunit
MSQLFLSADADLLADRLLEEIAARRAVADPFEPVSIVVPNRFVQQWLKFRIARAWGVAIHLQFTFLEQALWDWLREIDPRSHPQAPELLDGECYHLLALSILWNDSDAPLAPLQAYFEKGTHSRLGCRRAWQLAGRLASLIRDYEYHRQESLIQPWLDDRDIDIPTHWREREAAQRALFRGVTDVRTGRRALLNRGLKRNFKTLPQYVMEFLHDVRDYRLPRPRHIHLFGLSQISPLHLAALELLGTFHDWRIYHLNPLTGRLRGAPSVDNLRELAARYRGERRPDDRPGTELLQTWGRAGAESFHLTADFLKDPRTEAIVLGKRSYSSSAERVRRPQGRVRRVNPDQPLLFPQWHDADGPAENVPRDSVLGRLQSMILDGATAQPPLPQDASLQIVRCPGIWREAEAIRAGIVNILQNQPALQQTDIAVLVTNMELYRPVLTAVFERPPRRLSFGLADYSAARVSTYGQAVVGMLDLALENLSRTRVFEVLLNPCVLAAFKIERESALHWLTWADQLGIYHGWDAAEKRAQGYVGSPYFSWKLGLQRLRLGQYMDVVADDGRGPAPAWQGVIPFADVESGERERLDAFCRLVEGLLPILVRLRGMTVTASEWSETLLMILQRFLAVPDDRPEEEPVREALLESLHRFAEWDLLQEASPASRLPLALVREAIAGRLRDIPGRRNDVLSSGVTIAALQPQRPVPFEVIFLAGMGEKHFPGNAAPGPFDLRQIRRQEGDILPVEQQRFGFLEAILSARQKLIITYDGRDLQKDEEFQPAIPVAQLRRFVSAQIVTPEFRTVTVPLTAQDPEYLEAQTLPQDVLVHDHHADRVLALTVAADAGRLQLDDAQQNALRAAREAFVPQFSTPAAEALETRPTPTVSLAKLRSFLVNPAEAALKHHLRADDGWDDGRDEDFEPLTSSKFDGQRLIQNTLLRIVQRAETESVESLAAAWPEEFDRRYEETTARGKLPEGSFGKVDAAKLRVDVEATLNDGGLLAFLARQALKTSCGPFRIGESETPLGAKRHAPALVVPLGRTLPQYATGEVRIVGSWSLAWLDDETVDLLAFPWGVVDRKQPLSRPLFEPLLFAAALAASGECGGRQVVLHVVDAKGLVSLPLAGLASDGQQARAYLGSLATDFLDVACAEILPFDGLDKEFSGIFRADDLGDLPEKLLDRWQGFAAEGSWGFGEDKLNSLSAAGFCVPTDAAEKLRRRLRPLYLMLPPPATKNGDDA